METHIRRRLAGQLAKFAPSIDRISVRFDDVNGPRGGLDTRCHIKVVLSGRQSVVVEEVDANAWRAVVSASESAERAVRRVLERTGSRKLARQRTTQPARPPGGARSGEGSLVGRRVGRSQANLERAAARPEKKRRDVFVDTAVPGESASDRRVGAAGTATRNTKLQRAGMTATLEDSASGIPSRKSTRRSANRAKQDDNLRRRETRALGAPKARAARARARSAP